MMKAVTVKAGMKLPWGPIKLSHGSAWGTRYSLSLLILLSSIIFLCNGQDYGTPTEDGAGGGEPPPEMAHCNGIFMSYSFGSREREYPHVRT
ncbi:unnamed protein product [Brassica napus]|uniref:(rape) hypothetical protein n=1 Tax=Brassica napus TaxID=3708 RepID=A0A816KVS3_BRANA|nr:unnamed protein product [Brassica napus]